MRVLFLVVLLMFLRVEMPVFALPGDGSGMLKKERRQLSVKTASGSLLRSYFIYLPPAYDGKNAAPLLFLFHGGGGRGVRMVNFTGFDSIARENGLVVIVPEGYDHHWNDGRIGVSKAHKENVDDMAFVRAIYQNVCKELNIDRARVYATGVSNGAMLSLRLALEEPDIFAAVAAVVGSLPEPLSKKQWHGRPLPLLMINGTKDPLVPYEGGDVHFYKKKLGRVISVPDTVRFFASHNKCNSAPVVSELELKQNKSGLAVMKTEYACPGGDAEVVLYSIEGGGHTWHRDSRLARYLPELAIGKTCRDIDSSEIIWSFFQKHKLEAQNLQKQNLQSEI